MMAIRVPGVGGLRLDEGDLVGLTGTPVERTPDPVELKILRQICEEGPYYSLVTLTADLYGTELAAAPVQDILEELNAAGWITYRLTTLGRSQLGNAVYANSWEVPADIKATRLGYDHAGYRPAIAVVGPHRYKYPVRRPQPGHWADMTRFYHHGVFAVGFEIVRETFAEHRAKFPQHVHDYGDEMPPSVAVDALIDLAGITDETDRATFFKEAREEADIRMVAHDLRTSKLRVQPSKIAPLPEGLSRKQQILVALARLNATPGINAETLLPAMKEMGAQLTIQDLTKTVWELQKQQLVRFREGHNQHGSSLKRIMLTARGRAEGQQLAGMELSSRSKQVLRRSSRPQIERHTPTQVQDRDEWVCNTDGETWPCAVAKSRGIEITPVVAAPEYDPQKKAPLPDPIHQNEKPFIDETSGPGTSIKSAASTSDTAASSGKDAGTDTPTQYPEYSGGVSDEGSIDHLAGLREAARLMPAYLTSKYPALWKLVTRQHEKDVARQKAEAYLVAAAALEKIDPDEATRLTERAASTEGEPFTAEQVEILALLKELGA